MTNLRVIIPGQAGDAENTPSIPFSLEAEQQLLGALLTNNDVFDRVSQIIKPDHFYHPVHARIFDICSERIRKNALASPVTIKAFLEHDDGLKELGGPAYLARMAGAAISAYAARDYAQMIREFALRRELIQLGQDISARAATVEVGDEAGSRSRPPNRRCISWARQGPPNAASNPSLRP
jgi:replicative DNA helicase